MTNTEAVTDPRIARVYVAEVTPDNYGPDSWGTPHMGTEIRLYSRYQGRACNWTVLYVGPEGSCRRVYQGPIEPGPYAALIPQATVISAHPMPRARVMDLEVGDLVMVRGVPFRIDDSRGRFGQNPALIPVTA